MSNDKEYTVAVWELTFYKIDSDGEPERDSNGKIKLYVAEDYCCSNIDVGIDELTELLEE